MKELSLLGMLRAMDADVAALDGRLLHALELLRRAAFELTRVPGKAGEAIEILRAQTIGISKDEAARRRLCIVATSLTEGGAHR